MGRIRRHGALLVHAVVALAAYPIVEYLFAGTAANVYGVDVFDDGTVSRLGALAPTWAEHGLTLWDPFLTAGNAWFSQFAVSPIAVDSLLSIALTPFQAFFAVQLAMPILAGASMHLFARRSLRLPLGSAVAAGVLYGLSLWHYPIGFAGPAIPLLVMLVDRPVRGWALGSAALAAALALVLHQGLLQLALLVGALQLAWVLVAAPSAGRRLRLAVWATGWFLAAVIAAPTVVSLALALPESHRVVWDIAPDVSLPEALHQLGHRYAAIFLAVPVPGGWGLHPPYEGTWFAGAIGLPLAFLGARRASVAGGRHRFVAALVIIVPLLDLGTMLAGPMLEDTGPFGSFQFDRIRHLVPFVVAACAGIGLAGAGSLGRSRRRWGDRIAVSGAVAVLALQLPSVLGRLEHLVPLGEEVAPAWLRATWVLASGAGLALLAVVAWQPRTRTVTSVALACLLVVLALERGAYLRVERGVVPNGTTSWQARLGDSAILERIRTETAVDHSRALVTGLHPNGLLFHRVRSVTGYENVYPLRTHELLDVLFAPYLDEHPAESDYYRMWGNRAVAFEPVWARQVLDLLAARWIITDGPVDDELMTPILTADGRTLYRNESALPRAFVVTAERVFANRAALLGALAAADTADIASTAFLETPVLRSDAAGAGAARFIEDAPDRVELAVESPARGILVLSDTFMPGWRAEVDGSAVGILPAYGALRAVPVPAGASVVAFTYEPVATVAALWTSLGGLVVLMALAVVGGRRKYTATMGSQPT